MNPLISIVIPVYNVEKYLKKCINSVLEQTYDNFEVILVDDGSTDKSGVLCEEYARKDSRIKVYHKLNGGLSDARNYGVERANANLISFIDSDDWVATDYLEYLWYLMKKYDCDVSCADSKKVFEGETFSLKNCDITEKKLDTGKALERICYTAVGAVARLYKKELLLNNPFPIGRLYEDLANTYKIISESQQVVFSDKQIYVWVQREDSITHCGMNEKWMDIFLAANELYDFMQKNYPEYKRAASSRCVGAVNFFLARVFLCCSNEESRKYFKFAREFSIPHLKAAIKSDSKVSRKIGCIALYMGYFPYKILFNIKRHFNSEMNILRGSC